MATIVTSFKKRVKGNFTSPRYIDNKMTISLSDGKAYSKIINKKELVDNLNSKNSNVVKGAKVEITKMILKFNNVSFDENDIEIKPNK